MSRELLTDEAIEAGLADLPDWTRDGDAIRARYRSPSFLEAVALVDVVAVDAEEMDHHPDIDIRFRTTTWVLSTHSSGGLTALDLELARRITRAARERGSEPVGETSA